MGLMCQAQFVSMGQFLWSVFWAPWACSCLLGDIQMYMYSFYTVQARVSVCLPGWLFGCLCMHVRVVRMYVCMYACMYVCRYVCMYLCSCLCNSILHLKVVLLSMYACMHAHSYTHTSTHTQRNMNICLYVNVYMVHVYAYVYVIVYGFKNAGCCHILATGRCKARSAETTSASECGYSG